MVGEPGPDHLDSHTVAETDSLVTQFRERIGQLEGEWRDTLILERQSNVVGVSDLQDS